MSSLTSYFQRKFNTGDFTFREAEETVSRLKFSYTPDSIPPFIQKLSYKIKEEEESENNENGGPLISEHDEGIMISYNQQENKRLLQLSQILGDVYMEKYFLQKKLCLVLDLDHTLLHSAMIQNVTKDEQDYLNSRVDSMKDMDGNDLYKNERVGCYIKLRPYTREFLKEVSGMYKLFIYTQGKRAYAQEIGRLLDPDGVLFEDDAIVSNDDSTDTINLIKNLDILAGTDEKNTVIFDDSKDVWGEEHQKNLLKVPRYRYFTTDRYGGYKLNKNDGKGFDDEDNKVLEKYSKALQDVHKMHFQFVPAPQTYAQLQEHVKFADVRPVLSRRFRKKDEKRPGRSST